MASDLSSGTRTGATRPGGNGTRPAATGSETVGLEKKPVAGSAPSAGWGLPLVVLIAGMFMSVLDISIVNVAILTMQNDFGVTTDEIQWVATSYELALGVVVPVSGWLSDRFGPTRVYIVSLAGFAIFSALCGLAWNLESMVAFRVMQAVPGGILGVVTLTIVYRIVPRAQIGAAMGMYGLGIVVAPAIGPTLGGYFVEYVDWRLIFFINVPVGILGVVAAVMVLPRFGGGRAGRFDVLGFLTVATGLCSLLLALTEGQDWGWTSYSVLILLTLGVLSLALFVIIELEVDNPLLDVRVFRHWPFTNSLLLISVLSVGLFTVLFYVPLFFQQAQGLGAFETGLLLLPQALIMAVCMPIAGWLYDKIGPRWPATIGLVITALGTYLLATSTTDSSNEYIMWLLTFRAAGLGLCMMPIMTGGLSVIPPSMVSQASAFNNVVQRTTAALGLAILTAMVTGQQAQQIEDRTALIPSTTPMPQLGPASDGGLSGLLAVYEQTQTQVFVSAINDMYIVTAIVTGAGVVLALMLHSGKAPAPMADRQPTSARTRAADPRDTRPAADGVPEHRNGAAESRHGPSRTAHAPQREELEPERASSAP
jgi:EmrB/QacA subfamily drug resistance transporter